MGSFSQAAGPTCEFRANPVNHPYPAGKRLFLRSLPMFDRSLSIDPDELERLHELERTTSREKQGATDRGFRGLT